MRRPLLFMRKRSLLGPHIGDHHGFNRLSKSVGQFNDQNVLSPVFMAALESSLEPELGTLSSFTRASSAMVWDHDGVGHLAKSGEARFWGARRVENKLQVSSGDINGAGWAYTGGTAAALSATTWSTGSTGSPYLKTSATNYNEIPAAGDIVVISFDMQVEDLAKYASFRVAYHEQGASTQFQTITLSTTKKRYAATFTATGGASSVEVRFQFLTVTADQTVTTEKVQIENLSDQTNQNPSEFVSVGQGDDHGSNVDGVKYFDTYSYIYRVDPTTFIVTETEKGVENGDFSVSDTSDYGGNAGWSWTVPAGGARIEDGKARWDGLDNFTSDALAAAGVRYRMEYTVAGAALISISVGGNSTDVDGVIIPTGIGTHSVDVIATNSTGALAAFVAINTSSTVDNVTITPIHKLPADVLRGVIVETNSTNNCIDSEDLTLVGGGGTWTGVSGGTVTPNGGSNFRQSVALDTVNDTLNNAFSHVKSATQACTSNATHAVSCHVEKNTATAARLELRLSGGTPSNHSIDLDLTTSVPSVSGSAGIIAGSAYVEHVVDDVYRVSFAATDAGTNTLSQMRLYGDRNGGNNSTNWGGSQIEEYNVPTSYIPTTTAPVARAIDDLTCISPFITSTKEMTIAADIYSFFDMSNMPVATAIMSIYEAVNNNAILAMNTAGKPYVNVEDTVNTIQIFGGDVVAGASSAAFGFDADNDDHTFYQGGAKKNDDTDVANAIPFTSAAPLLIGNFAAVATNRSCMCHKNVQVYSKRVSDDVMARIS